MRSKDEILQWVVDTLTSEFQLRPEDLHAGAHLVDDLDLDSIDLVDLAVSLEEDRGIKLDEDDLKTVRTVGDAVNAVRAAFARGAASGR